MTINAAWHAGARVLDLMAGPLLAEVYILGFQGIAAGIQVYPHSPRVDQSTGETRHTWHVQLLAEPLLRVEMDWKRGEAE